MTARKVLLIAPQPFFSTRGTPLNVRALVETMAGHGIEVHLLVYPFGEDIEIPGAVIHRTLRVPGIHEVPVGASWRKVILDIPLACSAVLLCIKHKFQTFHGVEEGGFIAGTLGLCLRRPYIYDMDSCMIEQLQSGKFKSFCMAISIVDRFEKYFLRRAAAILTVAPALTKKSRSVAPNVPVYQIEDFPVASAMAEVPASLVEKLRKEFALEQASIALYTGNFEPYQGVDLAVQAWAILLQKFPNFRNARLLLVGGTPAQIEQQRARCVDLGLEDAVIFAGPRPTEEMGGFQTLANVLLSPRLTGGNTPLKLFSYMASGRPIVATTIAAHTNVLDESTAYLVEPTAESFAIELHRALTDPNASEKAKRARELVETRYSRQNFEARVCELYDFVLPSADGLPAEGGMQRHSAEAPTTLR